MKEVCWLSAGGHKEWSESTPLELDIRSGSSEIISFCVRIQEIAFGQVWKDMMISDLLLYVVFNTVAKNK